LFARATDVGANRMSTARAAGTFSFRHSVW
jgi:hypothetical protein